MKIYVGVTDYAWYNTLSTSGYDEVNFWRPGAGTTFKALEPNDMFLFKLHKPQDYIVGGGFFVRYSVLPSYLAWDAFGVKNGAISLSELNRSVRKYRSNNEIRDTDIVIGCIILTEPFFFRESNWIPIPKDWSGSIVQGKTYAEGNPYFSSLISQVQERLTSAPPQKDMSTLILSENGPSRYTMGATRHRLGQGGFRISVIDAYNRRCAITGEKSLPVLEAAHIRPYSLDGPHLVSNGLLLRSDFHQLFDKGYVTITPNHTIEVSSRLNQDFGNGKIYYAHHGKKLVITPDAVSDAPASQFLQWHNEQAYLG